MKTLELLRRPGIAWVLFKRWQARHILIDQAQDTNPDQWDIVKALADGFSPARAAWRVTQRTVSVGAQGSRSTASARRSRAFM
jgi:ATP-dependent helicase/nuclease subunit A